ncbi:PAS domain S-box protein [Spirulina sp. CS-785/01]|uniref:PAS domain S-box protein n=1 Tax=Spirulina sp. CS-785/01 TaxID=3021716 RepID=UPI00232BE852|nr:PAS domain S-box protein [Spirulina sp. CS-785/01]MDB9315731.1 PAS domain S-box protein [Spirulina sp. CS-785/01]
MKRALHTSFQKGHDAIDRHPSQEVVYPVAYSPTLKKSNPQPRESPLLNDTVQLQNLADNVLGVLYQFRRNPDGSYEIPYISAGCRQVYELEPEEVQADVSVLLGLTHPEDMERHIQSIEESAQTLNAWEWEGRCILRSGKLKWVKAISKPEKREDGSIIWDGWILDITAQKEYEAALEASNRRFCTFLEGTSEAFVALDENWCITHINPQGEHLLGKKREVLLHENFWEMFPEAVDSLFYDKYHEARDTGTAVKFEAFYDPLQLWLEVRAYPSGEELFVFFTNINARKHLEASLQEVSHLNETLEARVEQRTEELKASEQRFYHILSSLQDVVWSADPETVQITYMNPVSEKVYGRPVQDFYENSNLWLEIVHPEDQERARASFQTLMETGYKEAEYRVVRPDGGVRWLRDRAQLIYDDQGNIIRLDGLATDITERKLAEAEQQKLVSVVENSSDFVGMADMSGNAIYVNSAGRQMVGLPNSEAIKQTTMFDYFPPENLSTLHNEILPTLQEKGRWEGECYFKNFATGKFIPVEFNIFVVNHPQTGKPFCYATVTRDITERKQSEAKLKESEKRYQLLAEASPIGVYYTDAQGDCLYTNKPWRELGGLTQEEAMGKGWNRALHPEDRELMFQEWYKSAQARKPFRAECRFQRPDQSVSWVISQALAVENEAGEITGYVGTITDISDRKEIELQLQQQTQDLENTLRELQATQSQLIQSEKMSSLGQLVAGVAHEVNNPVNFIYGNLIHIQEYADNLLEIIDTYQQQYPEPVPEVDEILEDLDFEFIQEDLPKMLNSMNMGAKRIREIVASLRNFSRLDEADYKEVNVHDGIENTLMILNNRLKARDTKPATQIIKNYGDLPLVDCYPGQLNQVFMNILVNALDALDERDKNRSYQEVEQNPSSIEITTRLTDENRVQIVLQDNGKGIPEDIKTRIFDPFFTTKPIGKGTGLGMSISYQIITEKHNGNIACYSEPGQGAKFVIEIPLKQNVKD